jgi:membrane protein implicated in regulation of membrane protease activity
MITWWASLSVLSKILWGVTLTATLVFIIQSILTFVGADVDSNADFDMDASDLGGDLGGGINLYTFRNFVNFFLGFGWSAVLLGRSIASKGLLLLISVLVGVAFVALVMWLFKWLYSMQQTGNINVYKSAVGCTGTVYLPIPAERGGEGKVQITIQGAVREYNALTEGEALPTGKPIKVVEVINPGTLLVEPLDSLII